MFIPSLTQQPTSVCGRGRLHAAPLASGAEDSFGRPIRLSSPPDEPRNADRKEAQKTQNRTGFALFVLFRGNARVVNPPDSAV